MSFKKIADTSFKIHKKKANITPEQLGVMNSKFDQTISVPRDSCGPKIEGLCQGCQRA